MKTDWVVVSIGLVFAVFVLGALALLVIAARQDFDARDSGYIEQIAACRSRCEHAGAGWAFNPLDGCTCGTIGVRP